MKCSGKWPARPEELVKGYNDTWNSYQILHRGYQVSPNDWRKAREQLHQAFHSIPSNRRNSLHSCSDSCTFRSSKRKMASQASRIQVPYAKKTKQIQDDIVRNTFPNCGESNPNDASNCSVIVGTESHKQITERSTFCTNPAMNCDSSVAAESYSEEIPPLSAPAGLPVPWLYWWQRRCRQLMGQSIVNDLSVSVGGGSDHSPPNPRAPSPTQRNNSMSRCDDTHNEYKRHDQRHRFYARESIGSRALSRNSLS